jgi:hypothetical protein
MIRSRIKAALFVLSAAAFIAAPGGLAATPSEIYADYADNGRLDGNYPAGDLEAALENAALQGYPPTGSGGLPPAVEEEGGEGPSGGGAAGGGTQGGTPGGGTQGGTLGGGGSTSGGQAGGGAAPVESTGGLPFTGLDLSLIAAGALGLILLGAALRRVARQKA